MLRLWLAQAAERVPRAPVASLRCRELLQVLRIGSVAALGLWGGGMTSQEQPVTNEAKAVAWMITYTERDGSKRQAVYTHNAIADWRMFDPAATSEPLYPAAEVERLEAEVADLKARLVKQRRELGAEADQADAEAKRVCGISERAMNLLERLDPVEFQKFCKTEFDNLTGAAP